MGGGDRRAAAENLLKAGVVQDPATALQNGASNKNVEIRRWGLRYFPKNWARYQVVLEADIGEGKPKTRCRDVSTETPTGAPTLPELLMGDGIRLQRELETLVARCLAKQANPNSQ